MVIAMFWYPVNPSAKNQSHTTRNASQIEALIYSSATDLGDPGFDQYYGHGRIDATNIFGPDITPPSYSNLVESADPLLLGNTEIISIDTIKKIIRTNFGNIRYKNIVSTIPLPELIKLIKQK